MNQPPPTTGHLIVTHRALRDLMDWGSDYAKQAAASGRRVLWAPAHALGGSVSLRTWILDQAAHALGDSAPQETSLLLSGAADAILIADPASADSASLHWLTDLIACAEEVGDLTSVPPLPQLVVLVPARGGSDGAVSEFLGKLTAMGSEEIRLNLRGADPVNTGFEINALLGRNDDLLAALALSPAPLKIEDVNALVGASGAKGLAVSQIVSGLLFHVAGDYVMPAASDVRARLRESLPPESLLRGAALLLPRIEARYATLPDARVELSMRSGDSRRAVKLAREQFDNHLAAGRVEEALRLLEIARALHISIESGTFAREIDDAKMACLLALAGRYEQASDMIRRLSRRRETYGEFELIEWLAVGARHLALHAGFEARLADSLLRRAIRLAGANLDLHVKLTLMRVSMLSSDVMRLEDRSGWLLTHINYAMLREVSPGTLAQFYEDTGTRMFNQQNVRGAMRRLRKLIVMNLPDRQMSRALLLMARCRAFVVDHDAALRFATTSLHHALRAADLDLVRASARFLREAQSRKPRDLPQMAPSARFAKARSRLPSVADIQAPPLTDAAQVFEILQSRFGVTRWTRRRGSRVAAYGDSGIAAIPGSVFEESDGGWRKLASSPAEGELRSLALLRSDGSDLVVFESASDAEPREDALVRLLLADRDSPDADGAGAPKRRPVIDDYYRRALDHGIETGLHSTMERLFNKDVILYFEEQGIPKDELAEKLGVSRATLYRMYARSGLNI